MICSIVLMICSNVPPEKEIVCSNNPPEREMIRSNVPPEKEIVCCSNVLPEGQLTRSNINGTLMIPFMARMFKKNGIEMLVLPSRFMFKMVKKLELDKTLFAGYRSLVNTMPILPPRMNRWPV